MSNPILPEFNSLQLEAANEKTSGDRPTELTTDSNELARQLALNPSTSPEVLRKLANSRDAITRKNVTGNPNTPTEVLLKLGGEFPKQLLNNSIFSLLLLENPNLVAKIPSTTLRSLLKQDGVPVSFLEWAANRWEPELQFAVTQNTQTPRAALEKLINSHYSQVAEAARLHVTWAEEWRVALDAQTPKEILGMLIHTKHPQIAEAARLHVNWAGEMTSGWHEAAREHINRITCEQKKGKRFEKLVKIGLISLLHPQASAQELVKNCGSSSWLHRYAIAQHSNSPLDTLKTLAGDANRIVRATAKANLQSRNQQP